MRASGPDTLMPAWSSCASSRSTGTLSTSANCETVTSAIYFASSSESVTRLEPRRTRRHDQLRGLVRGEPLDVGELIDRLLGEVLARAHAAPGQRQRQVRAHALQQQQILRRHRLVERLLARDRLREQHVARAVAQLLDDVLVELLDGGELRLRHVGDLLDGGEALLREDGRHVLVHVQLLHEIGHQLLRLGLALGLGVGLGHDVQVPATQLAREADVLAAAPDRLRQLVLGYRDVHAVRVLIDHDRHHLRRRHGVDDELRRVLHVRDDVDALAGDLVGNRLYARAAHADAGAHRVDARIVALHRDLGAHPRIARGAEDLDQALADLGHLELEELDEELGRGAREEQLRATRLGAHFLQVRLDAVLGLGLLARDHVGARHEAFRIAAEIDVDAVAVDAFDDAAHERPDAVAVGLHHLGALGLAHLLHDHLLRLLGGNAAEGDRLDRLLDEAADFRLGIHLEPVLEPQLALGHLELLGIIRKHLPAAEGLVITALAVDGDARVPFLAVLLARCGRERSFERLEDYFRVDALLVGDGIDHHQDFFVHFSRTSRTCLRTRESRGLLLGREPCLANLSERHRDLLAVDLERDTRLVHGEELAGVAAAAGPRLLELDEHPRADEAPEVRLGAQHAVEAG